MIPILIIPYLTRTLGIEEYGRLVFIQTIMMFGTILVDFGFSWSATREIATNRNNKEKVNQVFSNTWTIQWCLAAIFSILIIAFIATTSENEKNWKIYTAGLGMVFGHALFPTWLFQGLEALRLTSIIQLSSKILTLPFIFWMVKSSDDLTWAIIFFSLSSLLTGAISVCCIHFQGLADWIRPDKHGVWQALRSGALLFTSKVSISLYTTLVPLAVGLWAGTHQLAYFNLADKIKTATQSLIGPISSALFPRMSLLLNTDRDAAKNLLLKSAKALTLISGFAGLGIWLFSERIMILLGGQEFSSGASILRWLAWTPLVIAFSNLFGIQIMLPLKMNKAFTTIIFMASTISAAGLYPLIQSNAATGAAQLILLTELIVTISMGIYLLKNLQNKQGKYQNGKI